MPDSKPLKVRWSVPLDLTTRHASQFIVQRQGDELFLSGFEVRGPILVGSVEEKSEQLARTEFVDAICTARIVMSSATALALRDALTENIRLAGLDGGRPGIGGGGGPNG